MNLRAVRQRGAERLSSRLNAANPDKVVSTLSTLLGGDGNKGVSDLVAAMKAKGMDKIAETWVSNNPNAPITPAQLKEALGAAKVTEMATELGTNEEALLEGMTEATPQIVDESTPEGSL